MGIRCFIAVPLEQELKDGIAVTVADLKRSDADVKWVRTENLHLTLKFLGDTDEGFLPALQEGLSTVASMHGPFTVSLQGLGLFPRKGAPRVAWIDINNYLELAGLQHDIEEALFTLGIKKEDRPFSPHLTIGRVRSQRNAKALLEGLQALDNRDFGTLRIRSFSLMKSELRQAGPEYTTLKEFDLKKEER
jgi:2'-5' RNA ligase